MSDIFVNVGVEQLPKTPNGQVGIRRFYVYMDVSAEDVVDLHHNLARGLGWREELKEIIAEELVHKIAQEFPEGFGDWTNIQR